jgi:uncharacterized protein (TIGR02246 family)
VDYVNRGGVLWKGNTSPEDSRRVKKAEPENDLHVHRSQISFLKPDIPIVHATWEWPRFTLPSGEEAKDFKGIITMVTVKQDGEWLIRAVQNTVSGIPAMTKPSEKSH